MADRSITEAECVNCRRFLVEKIDGLRREVKILLGVNGLTIVLGALQLYLQTVK